MLMCLTTERSLLGGVTQNIAQKNDVRSTKNIMTRYLSTLHSITTILSLSSRQDDDDSPIELRVIVAAYFGITHNLLFCMSLFLFSLSLREQAKAKLSLARLERERLRRA